MKYVWVVQGNSESGDEYGPFVFAAKPSEAKLRRLVKERCDPGDPSDPDGPGVYGSYTYIAVNKVLVE